MLDVHTLDTALKVNLAALFYQWSSIQQESEKVRGSTSEHADIHQPSEKFFQTNGYLPTFSKVMIYLKISSVELL